MTPLAPLTKQIFKSFQIVLPLGSSGRPEQTFPGDEESTEVDPRWLFIPASNLSIHKRVVQIVSAMLNAFIDDMSSAICKSWNAWKSSATFANVLVNAGVGILPPSGMMGSADMSASAILANMRLDDRNAVYKGYADAIAGALSQAWASWVSGYTHLTIPFPAAVALPGPIPPTPSVPIPVALGMSPGDMLMTPAPLNAAMLAIHGPDGFHASHLFQAFSQALTTLFTEWKAATQLANIVASGGVGMPVAGAIGVGGQLVGPPVLAQPEGMLSRLEKIIEFLKNLPTPKEIIANKVQAAIHGIKEDILSHIPNLPDKPSLPGKPQLPSLPGLPSKPTLPKPGGGDGPSLPQPGGGSHQPPQPGGGGHQPPQPGGGGHQPPQPGGGSHQPPQPGGGSHQPPQPGGGQSGGVGGTPPSGGGQSGGVGGTPPSGGQSGGVGGTPPSGGGQSGGVGGTPPSGGGQSGGVGGTPPSGGGQSGGVGGTPPSGGGQSGGVGGTPPSGGGQSGGVGGGSVPFQSPGAGSGPSSGTPGAEMPGVLTPQAASGASSSSSASTGAAFDPLNLAQSASRSVAGGDLNKGLEQAVLGDPIPGEFTFPEEPMLTGKPLGGGEVQALSAHEQETTRLVADLGWKEPQGIPGLSPPSVPETPLKGPDLPQTRGS